MAADPIELHVAADRAVFPAGFGARSRVTTPLLSQQQLTTLLQHARNSREWYRAAATQAGNVLASVRNAYNRGFAALPEVWHWEDITKHYTRLARDWDVQVQHWKQQIAETTRAEWQIGEV